MFKTSQDTSKNEQYSNNPTLSRAVVQTSTDRGENNRTSPKLLESKQNDKLSKTYSNFTGTKFRKNIQKFVQRFPGVKKNEPD